MPNQTLTQIDTACQAMTDGFFDYYQNLVSYFHQNPNDNLSYSAFASRTNRATNALISEQEAIFYIVAYGWQHYQSVQHLLSETVDVTSNIQERIRVVDYGCGQGVATLAFMDYLAQKNVAKDSVLEVHLIEPSKVSLDIAKLLISRLAAVHGIEVTIHGQQRDLDEALIPLNTSCGETFHLFSNVIDITAVQTALPSLAKQLKSCTGNNFLLANCPRYDRAQMGFELLHEHIDFSNSCYDKDWDITDETYRVLQARWGSHTSKQRLVALMWDEE